LRGENSSLDFICQRLGGHDGVPRRFRNRPIQLLTQLGQDGSISSAAM
jgi:hypothetical protein